ncbi:hypothetical protein [Salmonella enterica]|uniref:Uncharacterized protein n=1 Tax=Salmonella enterica TaxID=28901 RepID=A0A701YYM4_SALER|nr:hypothetical protein [Salmonella enterica]HAC6566708.1 hypothetical protein [Salmonella enterica subsp. indica]HBC0161081.1 hypothetical protein [Salmonella enterica subsp. indica]HCM1934017.1 hypothetical protein [Salmonella enterica subsp. indica serovar 6,7:z41:1,7]HCM1937538.1 hypothetical protein [Salmonella enterica subsp. indica serovar 6,7:z41:1,7]
MNTVQLPKKANIYKAMFYFFFSKEKFITLGAINGMAFDLEKDEYKKKLEEGRYSLNPDDHKHHLEECCDDLRKSLFVSVSIMLGVLFMVIAIGFYSGDLRITSSLDCKNAVSATGMFFLSWATLFQLGWRNASWKGCRLDELVGLAIFRHVFIIGSFLSLLYFAL